MADAQVLEVEGPDGPRQVRLSSPDRVMWPDAGITKLDVVHYYLAVAEGMVLAIEPMVTAGRHMVRMGDDGWAIYSQDGSLAAHFEFTVAITADGPRILNPWHLPEGAEAPGPVLSAEQRP